MKKIILFLLLASLTLSGCGGKEKEDTRGNEHEVPKRGSKTKEQESSCS